MISCFGGLYIHSTIVRSIIELRLRVGFPDRRNNGIVKPNAFRRLFHPIIQPSNQSKSTRVPVSLPKVTPTGGQRSAEAHIFCYLVKSIKFKRSLLHLKYKEDILSSTRYIP